VLSFVRGHAHASKSRKGQRGQALILLVFGMTVLFVGGAIAVDIGLWLSERRGAQTDADLAALAGAWELLNPAGTTGKANAAANTSLTANDEQKNLTPEGITVDNSCFHQGKLDSVAVNVSHASRSLFASIFNVAQPSIGAHAKACAGAAETPAGIVPIQIDNNPGPCFDTQSHPIFTALCPIELGSQGQNPRGMLDLDAPDGHCSDANGTADIQSLIENGAAGNCLINASGSCSPANSGPWDDCVAVQTGNPKNVLDGVHNRIARDGACDALYGNNDGTDDCSETVQILYNTGDPTTSIYEARDCDPATDGKQISPRLVTVIVLDNPPPKNAGNTGFPIVAFAGYYIAGCADQSVVVNSEADLDRNCNKNSKVEAMPSAEDGLYLDSAASGALPVPAACHRGIPHGVQKSCAPTATPSPSPTRTPTPTPTPTPRPGTPTPTPGGGPPGQEIVYGRFVNLITTDAGVGAPNNSTTVFGIALVE